MTRTVVGVLRGGSSAAYDRSLKTGATMLHALPDEKYDARDIFIDREGQWHMRGRPTDPGRALSQIDVVLNALLEGDASERRLIERSGVPFAGSPARHTMLVLNPSLFRSTVHSAGLLVPRGVDFRAGDASTSADYARIVFAQFAPPYLVMPYSVAPSSMDDIRIAEHVVDLPDAIADTLDRFGTASVQEYVHGTDAEVGVLEGFRGEALYALPPARLLMPGERLSADTHYLVPSDFTDEEKQLLMQAARAAHTSLGCAHFSHTRFTFTGATRGKRGKPYLIGVRPMPALHEGESFSGMLESVGSTVQEFLEHAIQLARSR